MSLVHLLHLTRWALFKCAVAIWGTVPLIALVARNHISFEMWRGLAISWAVSFLATFVLLLWLAEKNRSTPELVGVMCTISLGLPAIALAAFPAVGPPGLLMPPHAEEVISLKDLPPPRESGTPPLAYVVGLDVSGSFFPGKNEKVRTALLRLFDDHGTVGRAMQPDDQLLPWAFSAGTPHPLEGGAAADVLHGRRNFLQRLEQRTLLPRQYQDLDVKHTDILGFIIAICGELQSKAQFRGIRLVLFSDFMQSPALDQQQLNRGLSDVLSASATIPNFSIVAFHSPPASPEPNAIDVLRPLREALPGKVQEIDLERYDSTADEAEQMALPSALIANVVPPHHCDLVPPAIDGGGRSRVLFEIPQTKDFDEIFFGLEGDGSGAPPVTVYIPNCGGPSDVERRLDIAQDGVRFCKLQTPTRPGPLAIEVENRSDSNARGLLKIFIPARNQMRAIEIRVARFGGLEFFRCLIWVLGILNLLPLWLSIKLFLNANRAAFGFGALQLPAPR